MNAIPNWRRFELQDERRAFSRARPKTGNKIAASIEMMAITTRSSIKVKARRAEALGARLGKVTRAKFFIIGNGINADSLIAEFDARN